MSMTDNKFDTAIVSCKGYTPEDARHALTEALSAIGGLDFVRSGMKIVIKANLVSAKKPDTATTTLFCSLSLRKCLRNAALM